MRRLSSTAGLILLVALMVLVPRGARAADQPVGLEDGVARMYRLPRGGGAWHGRIRVPEGATALSIAVCCEGDMDIFLRRGTPLGGAYASEAEVLSRQHGPLETVRLVPGGPVPLRAGDWFVAVADAAGAPQAEPFELVAFVDRGRGTPTILPGEDDERKMAVHRDRPELRTFLPTLAHSLTLTLRGAESEKIHYRIDGPREYRRIGRGLRQITVLRADSPPGAYILDLSALPGITLPPDVVVRATWTAREGDAQRPSAPPFVRPGTAMSLTLGEDGKSRSRALRIPVGAGMGGIEIEATNTAGADVDLYVRRGGALRSGGVDADYFALSSAPVERLYVGGSQSLAPGIYYCEIVLIQGKGPVRVTVRVRGFPPGSGRGTWGRGEPPRLAADTWTPGLIQAGRAGVQWFSVVVPRGTRALHAMLLGASAPLDLILARRTDGSIMSRALTARVDERLEHVFKAPPDGPRFFMLGVMNRNAVEDRVNFRVAISFNRTPNLPADLLWPPLIAWQGRSSTVRAAAATVELTVSDSAGGSGTCVTPRGQILTCRHVLQNDGRGSKGRIQKENILVAFPARLDEPPVQSFVARVTYEDASRDLALLEITTDVFGRPLPSDLALPWLPLGDSSSLELPRQHPSSTSSSTT